MRIEDLGLSVRAEGALRAAGICLVENLIRRSGNDLLRLRNFGRKTLKEVRETLAAHSLSLAPDPDLVPEAEPDADSTARVGADDPVVTLLMSHHEHPEGAGRDALVDAVLALAPAERKAPPWLRRAVGRALPFLAQMAVRAPGDQRMQLVRARLCGRTRVPSAGVEVRKKDIEPIRAALQRRVAALHDMASNWSRDWANSLQVVAVAASPVEADAIAESWALFSCAFAADADRMYRAEAKLGVLTGFTLSGELRRMDASLREISAKDAVELDKKSGSFETHAIWSYAIARGVIAELVETGALSPTENEALGRLWPAGICPAAS